jgi:hypothetical protein
MRPHKACSVASVFICVHPWLKNVRVVRGSKSVFHLWLTEEMPKHGDFAHDRNILPCNFCLNRQKRSLALENGLKHLWFVPKQLCRVMASLWVASKQH